MLIILEGNEANFKTTIADKLSKELSLPIIKGSSFELAKCTNDELYKHFVDFAANNNVIYDRFIYSNRVYASLYDDYAILSNEQREAIEEMIKDNCIVVYLHADTETIKSRIRVRGDDYVNEDMVSKINAVYHNVMIEANRNLDIFYYDTGYLSSDDIVADLVRVWREGK